MKLIYPDQEQNKLLAQWISDRLKSTPLQDCQCLAALDDEGALKAAAVFFNYRWPSVEIGFIAEDPRWAVNRTMVAQALAYAFVQLKCKRITAVIDAKNKRARKAARRLGFREEGKLRQAAEKGDAFVYGLLPEEFRLMR